MQNIRVLIVEDEWIVSEEIKEVLFLKGYEVIGQVEDAASAIDILQKETVDVALLDINIKGSMDGIELATELLKIQNCAIIFLTAFDDSHFINRAKEVKPAAYMVKPYEPRNLQMAVEIAFNNLIASNFEPQSDSYVISDCIFLKENSRFKKISIESICYVEAVGSYTDIYMESGKSTLAINLKSFENSLSDPHFMRIHRSYLINLSHVDEFEGNRVFIKGKPIPISSTHKEEFLTRLKLIR